MGKGKRTFKYIWPVLFLALGLLWTGCRAEPWRGFPRAIDPQWVWPRPPAQARVAHVMDIRSHADLFEESGFWRSLTDWVAGAEDSSLARPSAVASYPRGGLLVTDTGRRLVHLYDWGRQRYIAIGPERPDGGLTSPVGVAATSGGRILVSDSARGSVEAFDSDGEWLGSCVEPGVLGRPVGIALDEASGALFVADVTSHCIAVFDVGGLDKKSVKATLLRRLGRHGEAPGEFNRPTHVALAPGGRLVVADSMNFRLQVLERDGSPVRTVGRMGLAPGQFAIPKRVAVDSAGRIIAVEGRYDALEFFSPEGELLLHIGSPGSDPGQFWLAAGVACHEEEGEPGFGLDHLLFVADGFNSRVQVFRFLDEAAER